MTVVNWNPYLQSICNTYAEWWKIYTLTDVVGKQRDEQKKPFPLLRNLMVETLKQEKESREEQQEKTERLTVLDGLRKYAGNHVLLTGRPGSGKSTALVRLLLELAKKAQPVIAREAERNEAISSTMGKSEKIPVLLELRYYQTSILDLIRDFLKRHQILLSTGEIEQLLFEGQFLLLVDGVNELPSEAARGDLQKFRQDYRNTTPMVFTTRDLGVGGDLGIEKKLQMQPLTEEQMREFVCGYIPEQGEEMLKQLEGRLRELGETPLLLWMLCSVFVDNQNQVPANLGSVFRRFTEIYNNKLKQDIPVTDESRRWWRRLLQHLAWVMTQGGTSPHTPLLAAGEGLNCGSKTEILVAIPKQQARDILTQFLKQQDYHQPRDAEIWLDDLLKHHLIQVGTENKIEFRHQLLQEYYAAERLLQELPNLSDEQLQWDYLNYLKWTEPVALMMQLVDKQSQAMRVVKLALAVDWQLGARLAGEVKPQWQEETVKLITDLGLPKLLEIRLLGISKSEVAVPGLIKFLEHQNSDVHSHATSALREIKSDAPVPGLIKLLEHEDSDVRYRAASALREIKSDAPVPGLIKLLEDEDSDVRYRAASALGKMKSDAPVPGLIQLLEDEDYYVRYRAASALGEIKSEAAIPGLIQLLQHEDSDVRSRAASALGEIKSDAAIPGLIQLLQHEDSDVRSRAASALGEIKSDAAVPRLIKLLEDESSSVRSRAAFALGEIKSDAAVPRLIKLLEDESSSVRDSTASALGKMRYDAPVPGLIKLLEDKDSDVRYRAVSALGKMKSDAAVPGLIKLLEDKDYYVRSRAAFALGEMKYDAAVPGLIKLLEDKDYYVRSRAAFALGEIKSDAALPGLIKLLEHQDSDVRYRAASALGEIKSDAALPGLIKLLEHQDSDVRYRAASALGEIKSDAAVPGLIKLLKHESSSVRYRAASALGTIKSKAAIPGLIKLLQHESSSVRSSAASALGTIKSEAAISGLIKLLEDESSSVRSRAASALGTIKSEAAISGLIKLLKDEDSSVCNSTASALGEIKFDSAIPGLIQLLNNKNFLNLNNGYNASQTIDALKKIQEHLKYYKPIPKPTMSKSTSHNYALLIGVGECEETKLSLPVTVKDIQALKTLLTDSNLCGYMDNNIRLLHDANATKDAILDSLTWLKQQAENDPEATILVFYSGHGLLHQSGDYYLIPHDTDRTEISDTALPANTFNQALREIPAQRLLVIIDSCHAQGMATSKDDAGNNKRSPIPKGFTQTALPKTVIDDLKQGTGRVIFTSSTGKQLSWVRRDDTMSIYTYHFLEALQGAANQPGDKVVKVSHLMNYLGETVPATTQQEYQEEQIPCFDFSTEGDFPVALLRGGKGLPQQEQEELKREAEEKIRGISASFNSNITGNVDNLVNINAQTVNLRDISSTKSGK
ncbi:MAG: HEAT repeat domain-containing protein [Calothrix sp. MO_192.B10]|nr:HEAT repeat domain-containing protein [Calothrix sp. MO_192.B10]